MNIHQVLANAFVRENKDSLMQLSEEGRKEAVKKYMVGIAAMPEDKLIAHLSSRGTEVSPEVQSEMAQMQKSISVPITGESPSSMAASISQAADREQFIRLQEEAAKQKIGIETRGGESAGSFQSGFADMSGDKLLPFRQELSKKFGQDVVVFERRDMFRDRGDILYVDPNDKKIKLLQRSALSYVGPGITGAGDIAGTIGGGTVGALATKHPAGIIAGESTGSGIGTTVGEYIRLKIGKAMGVHDLSENEIIAKSGMLGLQAAGMTAAMGGAMAVGKGLSHTIQSLKHGALFSKENLMKHGLDTEQAQLVLDEVNKLLPVSPKVQGTLGRMSTDPNVGSTEARLRKRAEFAQQFQERDFADQKALLNAFDEISKVSPTGESVEGVMKSQLEARKTLAAKIVARNEKELETRLSILDRTPHGKIGADTRQVILEKRQAADDAVDGLYTKIKEENNFNFDTEKYGIKIPENKEITKMRELYKERAATATTKPGKSSATGLFADKAGEQAKPIVKELPKGKMTLGQTKKPAPIADLNDYNRELSALKADLRALKSGRQFGDPQVMELSNVIDAMQKNRAEQLSLSGKGKLLDDILKAEEKTKEFYNIYDRSVIKSLTEKTETGVFKIESSDFVRKILKSKEGEAEQLKSVIADNPTLIQKWREGLSNVFKEDVIDPMKPYRGQELSAAERREISGKINSWINDNADTLNQFFSKSEIDELRRTGNLAIIVKKQKDQLKNVIKVADSKFGRGKLTSIDPDNLVKFVTNDSGSFSKPLRDGVQTAVSKIKYVKNITANYPGAFETFKNKYAADLRHTLVDHKTGFINPIKLSSYINEHSPVIKEIMGEEYLSNLIKIRNASMLLNKELVTLSEPEIKSIILQGLRATIAPPLTREGRTLTGVVLFDTARAHKALAHGLLDPQWMKSAAKLTEHKRITRETVELAASLGLIDINVEE